MSVLVPVVGPPSAPARAEDGTTVVPDEATVAALTDLTVARRAAARAVRRRSRPTRTIGVVVDPALLTAASAGTAGTQEWVDRT